MSGSATPYFNSDGVADIFSAATGTPRGGLVVGKHVGYWRTPTGNAVAWRAGG